MKARIQLKTFLREEKPFLQVLEITPPQTRFFVGDGPFDFVCGKCETKLAESVQIGVIKKCLLKCNICETLNETQ